MARRYYDLPPLATLAAFEAAARHLSFKQAAQELSVTPGAVSHQIRILEAELGTALFLRGHRSVALTTEGARLHDALAAGFARISQGVRAARDGRGRDTVTLGSSSAVATLWLSSAVIRFWRAHPEVDVNHVIRDTQTLTMPEMDLSVQYGRAEEPGFEHRALYRDRLVPVGDRAAAARLQGCALDTLAQERLIHLDTANRNWTSWAEWFRALGHGGAVARGMRVTHYSVALHAAQEGAGIALGWQRLVGPLIAEGRLCEAGPHAIDAPHRYYLLWRRDTAPNQAVEKLKHWLLAEIAQGGAPGAPTGHPASAGLHG
jgi:DNA-binding transcriptional LysR family regulator